MKNTIKQNMTILGLLVLVACGSANNGTSSSTYGDEDTLELDGVTYYARTHFCKYSDECVNESEEIEIIKGYNAGESSGYDEEVLETKGNGIIAVYLDEDNNPDILIIDSNKDKKYDKILRPSVLIEARVEAEAEGCVASEDFQSGDIICDLKERYCGNVPHTYCDVHCDPETRECYAEDLRENEDSYFYEGNNDKDDKPVIDPVLCFFSKKSCMDKYFGEAMEQFNSGNL